MIIAGFGTYWNTCYRFPLNMMEDNWSISRPPISARVGGLPGAFDYYGDTNFPISPFTLRKTFLLINAATTVDGAGSVTVNSGSTMISGTGTNWVSALHVGDTIDIPGNFTSTVTIIYRDDLAEVAQNSPLSGTYFYKITHTNALEEAIAALRAATIDVAESKLWILQRDDTTLWAWAKCTALNVSDTWQSYFTLKATVEFFCREGLWH